MKRILGHFSILLTLFCLLSGSNAYAATAHKSSYVPIDYVTGTNSDLALELHEKSFDLDLAKTRNMRVRLKARKLFQSIPNSASFKVELYEVKDGSADDLISAQVVTINRGTSDKNRILSIDAGAFTTNSKKLKFVVYDTEGNYVNTYETTVTATNIDTQPQTSSNIELPDANCGTEFGDCQMNQFFRKVTFEAKKQRQASTRVVKDSNGFYKVTIPLPRQGFKSYRGSRVRTANAGGGNGGGTGTSSFGETIDASVLRLGESSTDHSALSYDATNNQLEIGFPTAAAKTMVIGDDGKVGIGIDPATAYLDIKGGDTATPSLKIEPGVLTSTPQNGAIEFDGSNLYFTKQGVRAPIGAGAQGPSGPAGANGAVGPQGPVGTITANLGGTINGPLVFTKNGSIAGTNIPFTGTLNGGTLVNTTIKNAKVSQLVSPDGSPDPAAVVDNDGNIGIGTLTPSEKLEVAGNVKATRFIGDGSGLTGINVSNTTINNTTIVGGTATLDKLILKPAMQNNLTNVNPIVASGSLIRIQGASGPVDFAPGATQIDAVGVADGQVIVLKGMSNANSVTLDDGSGLELSGGVKFIMGLGDTLTLVYDALTGNWVELSRTDV